MAKENKSYKERLMALFVERTKTVKADVLEDQTKALRASSITPIDVKEIANFDRDISGQAVREGQIFRILQAVQVDTMIAGQQRKALGAIVEAPDGEQRVIYMTSLLRALPPSQTTREVADEVRNFNLGILQGMDHLNFTERFAVLAEAGWVKAGATVAETYGATVRNAEANPGFKAGDEIKIRQTYHNLVKATDQEVATAKA